ncbi:hypothetical protein GCM10023320_23950 [Pseudonocardia adelaidensis]|uniref:Mersacidin/lichenicidin family type 2 lantibiotic n=1 Tax=Pseudonocardia adelaidensis TaxID=648754 RepID=A0ABP9NN04_9PSEU
MPGYTWGGGGAAAQQAPASPVDQYSPRARLAALIARCELDPEGVGAAVKADPVAALQSVGFSQGQAQALTAAPAQADDPVVALAGGCNDTSCIISLCPPTCFATIPAIPGLCPPPGGGNCGFLSLF